MSALQDAVREFYRTNVSASVLAALRAARGHTLRLVTPEGGEPVSVEVPVEPQPATWVGTVGGAKVYGGVLMVELVDAIGPNHEGTFTAWFPLRDGGEFELVESS